MRMFVVKIVSSKRRAMCMKTRGKPEISCALVNLEFGGAPGPGKRGESKTIIG